MRLKETDAQVAVYSQKLADIELPPDLEPLEVPLRLLPDFEDEPEARGSDVIRHTFAAYRQSKRTIFVNGSTFFRQSDAVQLATLAHELGHAVCHRARDVGYDLHFAGLDEEIVADILASRWGYREAIIELREPSYGDEYSEILRSDTEVAQDELVERMEKWWQAYHLRKLLEGMGGR
jgi:antirestriction protein ArdC